MEKCKTPENLESMMIFYQSVDEYVERYDSSDIKKQLWANVDNVTRHGNSTVEFIHMREFYEI